MSKRHIIPGLLGIAAMMGLPEREPLPRTHRQIAGVSPITPEKSAKRKKENAKRKQARNSKRKRKP